MGQRFSRSQPAEPISVLLPDIPANNQDATLAARPDDLPADISHIVQSEFYKDEELRDLPPMPVLDPDMPPRPSDEDLPALMDWYKERFRRQAAKVQSTVRTEEVQLDGSETVSVKVAKSGRTSLLDANGTLKRLREDE